MTAIATETQDIDDVVTVSTMTVACDGTADYGSHPRVFLKLDDKSHDVVCPYCSRVFQLDPNAKVSGGH